MFSKLLLLLLIVIFLAVLAYGILNDMRGESGAKQQDVPPFEIRLSAIDGPGLRAVIKNISDREQIVIHDDLFHQPSRLILEDATGKETEVLDTRSVISSEYFPISETAAKRLQPGEEAVLVESRFAPDVHGGQRDAAMPPRFRLAWGPFTFVGLPPGEYKARVIWKSVLNTWLGEKTNREEQIPNIWFGTVESNEVEVALP